MAFIEYDFWFIPDVDDGMIPQTHFESAMMFVLCKSSFTLSLCVPRGQQISFYLILSCPSRMLTHLLCTTWAAKPAVLSSIIYLHVMLVVLHTAICGVMCAATLPRLACMMGPT